MYVAQTSLIPVAVALARFVEIQGWGAFWQIYPYWYLGVPFRYLMGPLVPLLMVLIHRYTGLSFFVIPLAFMVIGCGVGSIGWGVLAGAMSGKKRLGVVTAVVLVVLPWKYVTGLLLGETSVEVVKMCIPWILWLVWKKKVFSSEAFILLALLINTSIIPMLAGGLLILAVLRTKNNEENGEMVSGIMRELWLNFKSMIVGIVLVTAWYGPKYWWRLAVNPWIGGIAGGLTVVNIWVFARNLLPIVLAMGFTRMFSAKLSKYEMFVRLWLLLFGLLTLFRFMGNPIWWQDWIYWVPEIEIGLGLLISILVVNRKYIVLMIVPVIFVAALSVWLALKSPMLDVGGLIKLAELAGDKRVFLSGSTVWWADALYNIVQVRGGADRVATNQDWNKVAWEIREGEEPAKSLKWLKLLKVEYVLVHTNKSKEYYKDFRHIEKWEQIGKKIWAENGDEIYELR